jgi:hypothetical protein
VRKPTATSCQRKQASGPDHPVATWISGAFNDLCHLTGPAKGGPERQMYNCPYQCRPVETKNTLSTPNTWLAVAQRYDGAVAASSADLVGLGPVANSAVEDVGGCAASTYFVQCVQRRTRLI